jgi:hypothetical protein
MQASCEQMHNFNFFWTFVIRNSRNTIEAFSGSKLEGFYRAIEFTFCKSALELEASV